MASSNSWVAAAVLFFFFLHLQKGSSSLGPADSEGCIIANHRYAGQAASAARLRPSLCRIGDASSKPHDFSPFVQASPLRSFAGLSSLLPVLLGMTGRADRSRNRISHGLHTPQSATRAQGDDSTGASWRQSTDASADTLQRTVAKLD